MLVIIVLKNIKAEQADVNNIFTELDLKKKIYIKPPDGMKIKKSFVLLI